MTEWISVKNSLPEINTLVLLLEEGERPDVGLWDGNTWVLISSGCGCCDKCGPVFYWMPLPEKPE